MTAMRAPDVPGYEILERLDAGGMGVVYKARQLALDRLTAVKFMLAQPAADPVAVARFLREAKAAARLSHPAIVQIHDIGRVDGIPYIVMEYVEGLDLAKLTAQGGPLTAGEACRIVRDAALGLQHAHERGLVHRDIKPSNLMVVNRERQRPEQCAVKILDFGLARLRDADSDFGLTHSDQPLGTPDFIAPEQIDDPRAADARSDLYSLGCTFYFLLTGQAPFAGGSLARKLDGHRWQAPLPLRDLQAGICPELESIVQRLLAKDPNLRFGSAAELVKCLNGFLADTPFADDPSRVPPVLAEAGAFMAALTLPQQTEAAENARELIGHVAAVTCLAFSADGSCLASSSLDGTAALWDPRTGQPIQRFSAESPVLSLAVAANGEFVLTGDQDGRISHWEAVSGLHLRWFNGHRGPVQSLAFLPNGRRFLSGGADQTIRQWQLRKGSPGREIGGTVTERHWGTVRALVVSADGRHALSGSEDRTARLWDLTQRRELRCFRGHEGPVVAVALSPDGFFAVTVDGTHMNGWDTATGREVQHLDAPAGAFTSVAVTADGCRIAAGCGGRVLIWARESGQLAGSLASHRSDVTAVAVSANGWIASGAADGSIRLWQDRPAADPPREKLQNIRQRTENL